MHYAVYSKANVAILGQLVCSQLHGKLCIIYSGTPCIVMNDLIRLVLNNLLIDTFSVEWTAVLPNYMLRYADRSSDWFLYAV